MANSNYQMINGVFPFFKPRGITSNDLVGKIKYQIITFYQQQYPDLTKKQLKSMIKVGHGGTLDKSAQGVMVIGIGRGTKQLSEYLKGDKQYIATGEFGYMTDTLDATGSITCTSTYNVTQLHLENCIQPFIGVIDQIPPVYSAIKIKGVRASDIARNGTAIEMKSRKITIYDIQLQSFDFPKFVIVTSVSGGTYIRSLIRDIGMHTAVYATMIELTRIKQGAFTIDECMYSDDTFFVDKLMKQSSD
jgi:tRNA pseudouridine55 synthase